MKVEKVRKSNGCTSVLILYIVEVISEDECSPHMSPHATL